MNKNWNDLESQHNKHYDPYDEPNSHEMSDEAILADDITSTLLSKSLITRDNYAAVLATISNFLRED